MSENWIQEAITAVENIAKGVVAEVEADGKIIWNGFVIIWETLGPSEWAILEPIVVEAISDAFNGDLADLETTVLMKAEAAGVDFLKKLDSAALQIVLGLFTKAPPPVA